MRKTIDNLCNSCTNIGCGIQFGIARTECVFYMPPQLEPDNCGNYVVQGSTTTENDLAVNYQYTDEEIAKSFIEDVEAVKDQLPYSEQMDFPNTFDEFVKDYGFKDKDEVYTNGSELIQVFRVKQWLEHISIIKNDLGVDCISRQAVLDLIADHDLSMGQVVRGIHALPLITPQEPRKGYWIHHDEERWVCSEHWECSYCHKTTMTNPMYPYNVYDHMYYCPKCGADMRECFKKLPSTEEEAFAKYLQRKENR